MQTQSKLICQTRYRSGRVCVNDNILWRRMQVLAQRVQGSESFFASYIQNLPVGVSGIPMFFGPEPLRAIDYAPVAMQVGPNLRYQE